MGIQTFDDTTLQLLKRRHSSQTAVEAVRRCREAGFQNISIDLIYGLPGETKERWVNDLRQAIRLDVEHISAYHLTYEEDTPIYNMLKQHQIEEVDEDSSLQFFTLLIEHLQNAGYEHYEISNFCRPTNTPVTILRTGGEYHIWAADRPHIHSMERHANGTYLPSTYI